MDNIEHQLTTDESYEFEENWHDFEVRRGGTQCRLICRRQISSGMTVTESRVLSSNDGWTIELTISESGPLSPEYALLTCLIDINLPAPDNIRFSWVYATNEDADWPPVEFAEQ